MFNVWKDYKIQEFDLNKRYSHPATLWYVRKHTCLFMNDDEEETYKEAPPSKTLGEKV